MKYLPDGYKKTGFVSEAQERLYLLINAMYEKNLIRSRRSFDVTIGAADSWSRNFSAKVIPHDRLRNISEAYPMVNINWLATGEGEMFKEESVTAPMIRISNDKSKNSGNINMGHDQVIGTEDSNRVLELQHRCAALSEKIEFMRQQIERDQEEIKRLRDMNDRLMDKVLA